MKDALNKAISEEFKRIFKTVVMPQWEKMVEEIMGELFVTVKKSLEENDNKIKEIEERIDQLNLQI